VRVTMFAMHMPVIVWVIVVVPMALTMGVSNRLRASQEDEVPMRRGVRVAVDAASMPVR
jgi:hypothetical protein